MMDPADEAAKLDVRVLPDRVLSELLRYFQEKIDLGSADFEEFSAYVVCQNEFARRKRLRPEQRLAH